MFLVCVQPKTMMQVQAPTAINNITLGYTLPKRIVRNLGIESLRVYGAADNVALFAARKGLDPRQGYVSSTTSTYGALRSISAGVKLTF